MHINVKVPQPTVTLADITTQLTALNYTKNVTCMSVKVAPYTDMKSDGKELGCTLHIEVEEGDNR